VSDPQTHLAFSFDDLLAEIDALERLADDFIEPVSKYALRRYREDLRSIRENPSDNTKSSWEISTTAPLQTKVSDGNYEAGTRHGALQVRGELSTIWEVRHPIRRGKKPRKPDSLLLVGKASTVMRILQLDPHTQVATEIAMWRAEVGDHASPGCHFHIQVLGHADEPPFPRALSVPRLPSIAITPMDAFEFLLGELFQDKWCAQIATRDRFHFGRWREIQTKRLVRLLDWQKRTVEEGADSAWVNLKLSKPQPLLFGDV
jgi:hypothetical protein